MFKKNVENGAELLQEIWENLDKTPYVLFTGEEAIGIFVINNENTPVIEHMHLIKTGEEADRIKEEIMERFERMNELRG